MHPVLPVLACCLLQLRTGIKAHPSHEACSTENDPPFRRSRHPMEYMQAPVQAEDHPHTIHKRKPMEAPPYTAYTRQNRLLNDSEESTEEVPRESNLAGNDSRSNEAELRTGLDLEPQQEQEPEQRYEPELDTDPYLYPYQYQYSDADPYENELVYDGDMDMPRRRNLETENYLNNLRMASQQRRKYREKIFRKSHYGAIIEGQPDYPQYAIGKKRHKHTHMMQKINDPAGRVFGESSCETSEYEYSQEPNPPMYPREPEMSTMEPEPESQWQTKHLKNIAEEEGLEGIDGSQGMPDMQAMQAMQGGMQGGMQMQGIPYIPNMQGMPMLQGRRSNENRDFISSYDSREDDEDDDDEDDEDDEDDDYQPTKSYQPTTNEEEGPSRRFLELDSMYEIFNMTDSRENSRRDATTVSYSKTSKAQSSGDKLKGVETLGTNSTSSLLNLTQDVVNQTAANNTQDSSLDRNMTLSGASNGSQEGELQKDTKNVNETDVSLSGTIINAGNNETGNLVTVKVENMTENFTESFTLSPEGKNETDEATNSTDNAKNNTDVDIGAEFNIILTSTEEVGQGNETTTIKTDFSIEGRNELTSPIVSNTDEGRELPVKSLRTRSNYKDEIEGENKLLEEKRAFRRASKSNQSKARTNKHERHSKAKKMPNENLSKYPNEESTYYQQPTRRRGRKHTNNYMDTFH